MTRRSSVLDQLEPDGGGVHVAQGHAADAGCGRAIWCGWKPAAARSRSRCAPTATCRKTWCSLAVLLRGSGGEPLDQSGARSVREDFPSSSSARCGPSGPRFERRRSRYAAASRTSVSACFNNNERPQTKSAAFSATMAASVPPAARTVRAPIQNRLIIAGCAFRRKPLRPVSCPAR